MSGIFIPRSFQVLLLHNDDQQTTLQVAFERSRLNSQNAVKKNRYRKLFFRGHMRMAFRLDQPVKINLSSQVFRLKS